MEPTPAPTRFHGLSSGHQTAYSLPCPAPILRLWAVDGQTFGYAPTDGWAFAFGYLHEGKHVDIEVLPCQWVTRYPDNSVTVTDQRPTEDYAAQNSQSNPYLVTGDHT